MSSPEIACTWCERFFEPDLIREDKYGEPICMECAEDPEKLCNGEWCFYCGNEFIPDSEMKYDLDGDPVCAKCDVETFGGTAV